MTSTQEQMDLTGSQKSPFKKYFGTVMTVLVAIFTVIVLIGLFVIVFDVASEGLKRLSFDSFTELPPPPGLTEGGFGNAILGTLITLGIGAAISVPFGVMGAIYLSEFGRGTRLAYAVKFCANVLSGVPAILAGLFAYSLVVITTGSFSAFAGGLALSVVMLPIVIRTVEEGLLLVPREMREASIGVGATQFQTVTQIVLPAALPAIATGVTLALARAGGEAAPLLFTALNNNFWNTDPSQPIATLPVLIYFFAIIPYEPQRQIAWTAALVLLAIILTALILARVLTPRKVY